MLDDVGLDICKRRGVEEVCLGGWVARSGSCSTMGLNFTRRGASLVFDFVAGLVVSEGLRPPFWLLGKLIDDNCVARLLMEGLGSAWVVVPSLLRPTGRMD